MTDVSRALASILCLAIGNAMAEAPSVSYEIRSDHADGLYRCGETSSLTVAIRASSGALLTDGRIAVEVDDGGPTVVARTNVNLAAGNPFVVSATRKSAGTLRFRFASGTSRPKMFGVLFDCEQIRPLSPCPNDLAVYWASERKRLEATVPADVSTRRLDERCTSSNELFLISVATFGGKRVSGVLWKPRGEGSFPLEVVVPGAGSGNAFIPGASDRMEFVMNVHCFDPGADARQQQDRFQSWNAAITSRYGVRHYMFAGMGRSREEYVFHDVLLGMLRILEAVRCRPDVDASRMTYFGSSQGAAFGLWLTALDGGFSKAFLNVPALCDLLAFQRGRDPGGPNPVLGTDVADRPTATAVAPYYDAANFAPMVRCPLRVIVGLSDEICPFVSAVAAFNVLGSADKRLYCCPGIGHEYETPYLETCMEWLRK